jgi:hypothetical protein
VTLKELMEERWQAPYVAQSLHVARWVLVQVNDHRQYLTSRKGRLTNVKKQSTHKGNTRTRVPRSS